MNATPAEYLPLRALAGYAGLSVRTLRGFLHHPLHPLPCYRIGGKVLVRRSEFDHWATQFREMPTPTAGGVVTQLMRGLR